jgi:hypothetical protein
LATASDKFWTYTNVHLLIESFHLVENIDDHAELNPQFQSVQLQADHRVIIQGVTRLAL